MTVFTPNSIFMIVSCHRVVEKTWDKGYRDGVACLIVTTTPERPQSPFQHRYADMLVLALLMAYVLAGIHGVPFHADEADHLFKARDYVIYFVLRDPDRLRVEPPVAIDSEQH